VSQNLTPLSRHFVYILECLDHSFYTGYTTDLERRYQEHLGVVPLKKDGTPSLAKRKGAKYTLAKKPVQFIIAFELKSRSEALKLEYTIKQLRRAEKEKLIDESLKNDKLINDKILGYELVGSVKTLAN
jgi:putative endonuclease